MPKITQKEQGFEELKKQHKAEYDSFALYLP